MTSLPELKAQHEGFRKDKPTYHSRSYSKDSQTILELIAEVERARAWYDLSVERMKKIRKLESEIESLQNDKVVLVETLDRIVDSLTDGNSLANKLDYSLHVAREALGRVKS